MKNKAYISFIILLLIFSIDSWGQNSCVDSFENISYYHPKIKNANQIISFPALFADSSILYNINGALLIKEDKNNKLLWAKSISNIGANTEYINHKQQLILSFYEKDQGLIKLNATGGLIWAKKINSNIAFSQHLINSMTEGKDGDIILCSHTGGARQLCIALLDSNANQKWARCYNLQLVSNAYLSKVHTVFNGHSIYVIAKSSITSYWPEVQTNFLLLMELDVNNGNILRKKKFSLNDSTTITKSFYNTVQSLTEKGVISDYYNAKCLINGEWIIAGRKAENLLDNNRFFALKLDSSLNILNYKLIKFDSSFSFFRSYRAIGPYISPKGLTLFSLMRDSIIGSEFPVSGNDSYSFLLDKDLNILSQRKQSLLSLGLNNYGGFQKNVTPFIINPTNSELIYHPAIQGNDSLLFISKISPNILGSVCMGSITNDLMTESPGVTEKPFPNITETPLVINSQPYPVTIRNEMITPNKFCKQISVCDTIKINGSNKYCLPDSSATFTLYKGRQCLRGVNWLIDTNFIKITSQPDDTTINVKFLRPYHGYISAVLKECVLKDSLYIDVNVSKQKLYLGKDTMLCTGGSILLNAGSGFKNYLWQDGSRSNVYTVSQPGTYYVMATDSCGNTFKDTIVVKPMDVLLNISFESDICQGDTVTFQLDPKLINYTIIPNDNSLLSGSNLKLFPQKNTLYKLSGDRFSGCTLFDTLLIKVKPCPLSIYFPNAFSPNQDGLNDIFKPIITGKISEYYLAIYNHYGQMVFNTTNPNIGWDGNVKGEPQNSGIFVWYSRYKEKNKAIKVEKGSVLLVR